MGKIEKTFFADGLTIKLSIEGKVDSEVKKVYMSLVKQINLLCKMLWTGLQKREY